VATFVRGDVVVVPFPFSDLSQAKRRPALVLASFEGDDLLLCQITSQLTSDAYSIALEDADFETGSLKHQSCIRPNRLFTADRSIVLYRIGRLKPSKLNETTSTLVAILKPEGQ